MAPLLRTVGISMLPSIHPGDVLVVDRQHSTLRDGDVGVFRVDDGLVAHRVVWSGRQMGDNTSVARRFAPDDIVGLVVAVHRDHRVIDLATRWQRLLGRALALRGLLRIARRRFAVQP